VAGSVCGSRNPGRTRRGACDTAFPRFRNARRRDPATGGNFPPGGPEKRGFGQGAPGLWAAARGKAPLFGGKPTRFWKTGDFPPDFFTKNVLKFTQW
jgi:hypothetical protein